MAPLSELVILLPPGEPPGLGEVRRRLVESAAELEPAPCPRCRWALEFRFEGQAYRAELESIERDHLENVLEFASERVQDACAGATACEFGIRLSTSFGDRPQWDFHRQLRLARILAPEGVALLDQSAVALRSRAWWQSATETDVPPPPTAMFNIHTVIGDHERAWMHTHGLSRCGCPELEMLDLPAKTIDTMVPLLEAVAAQWMCDGAPDPGESFLAGHMLEVAWIPHEDALAVLSPRGPGGANDRDDAHAGAVLVCKKRSWTGTTFHCPSSLASRIADNPMFFLPDLETDRQALLAADRLPRFVALLRRFAGEPEWRFLVKLGYAVDEGEPNQREHLWFEVHEVRGDSPEGGGTDDGGAHVVATLLNAPYHVARLSVGDRAPHDLSLLTDWAIFSPEGRFNAQNAATLEALVQQPN